MSADRVTDIFHEFDTETRARLVVGLGPETTAALRKLLRYPPHTAGSLMTTEFVSVPADWTVAQTLQHIREVERSSETIYAIYVTDPATKNLVAGRNIAPADHQRTGRFDHERRPRRRPRDRCPANRSGRRGTALSASMISLRSRW